MALPTGKPPILLDVGPFLWSTVLRCLTGAERSSSDPSGNSSAKMIPTGNGSASYVTS